MIDLHYWPTPNGKKVTILLEELGMPCNIVPCNIGKGDQFEPEFLKISPNNRMPALVDHAPADGGPTISVFESGAIMMYLAEKAGRFYPQDIRRRYEVNQWVMWQMANQGPKLAMRPLSAAGRQARRPVVCGPPLHRRGQPALRCPQQSALRPPLSRWLRIYHRRHDLLSVDGQLEGPGARHRRVQIFQTLVRRTKRTPGSPARPGRHRRPDGGPRELACQGTRAAHEIAIQSARPTGASGRGIARNLTANPPAICQPSGDQQDRDGLSSESGDSGLTLAVAN